MNFFAFCTIQDRKKFDNQIESFEVLCVLNHNGFEYTFCRQTTKKVLVIKGRELLYMKIGKYLPNGDYMCVFKSFEDKHFPKIPKYDRIAMLKSGLLFETAGKTTSWRLNESIGSPIKRKNFSIKRCKLSKICIEWYKDFFSC